MKKLDLKDVPDDLKPNPVFDGMDESLKNPERYKEIEDSLNAILKIDHVHKTAKSYSKCKECTDKRHKRREEMFKFGFKSLIQYLEWKKIMDIIINKKDIKLR